MIKNLQELDLHPTKIAFSLYLMRQFTSDPIEHLIFVKCSETFAARQAKWVSVIKKHDRQLEFWIIYNGDEALSMVWRIIYKNAVETFGMIQYELRPYLPSGVERAIKNLPIQKAS